MDLLLHRAASQTPVDAIILCRPSSYSPSTFHLHRSFLGFPPKPTTSSGVCYSSGSGSPPPPEESDPPSGITTSDLEATFSKVQDRTQIFFAVLFWMSLFFWHCAWDGKNDDDPTKKSRFRK